MRCRRSLVPIVLAVFAMGCNSGSDNDTSMASAAEDEVMEIFKSIDYDEVKYFSLMQKERYVVDVVWLITEVNNGGLEQWFYNYSGGHAQETLEALRAIGAEETYAIVQEACSLFPDGMPERDHVKRVAQVEAMSEGRNPAFNPLDDRFYSMKENLYELLLTSWKKSSSKAQR
jgi:hypothetical protein